MKFLKKIVVLLVAASMFLAVPTVAFAAEGKPPYTDVVEKDVGKNTFKAVSFIKKHHGFDGVVTGKKFYLDKRITRLEFLIILVNFYGVKKVPITATDLKKANKPITYKWMWAKLGAVAKKLGTSIDNPSTSASIVHRDGAARIVYKICRENKKMQPKK